MRVTSHWRRLAGVAFSRPHGEVTCDQARESLSAAADGEDTLLTAGALEQHLAHCARCRAFSDDVVTLNRTLRVHAADVPRDGQRAVLEVIGVAASPTVDGGDRATESPRRRVRRVRHGVAVGALWASALVPLGVAVPALAAGSFAHVHIVGTHTPSPCTLRPAHAARD